MARILKAETNRKYGPTKGKVCVIKIENILQIHGPQGCQTKTQIVNITVNLMGSFGDSQFSQQFSVREYSHFVKVQSCSQA